MTEGMPGHRCWNYALFLISSLRVVLEFITGHAWTTWQPGPLHRRIRLKGNPASAETSSVDEELALLVRAASPALLAAAYNIFSKISSYDVE